MKTEQKPEVKPAEAESTIVVSSSEDDAKTLGGVGKTEEQEAAQKPKEEKPEDNAQENGHSKPRKKNSAKERIQGLVRDSKDKDDRIAELEEKLEERKPEKANEDAKEPNIDNFDTYAEYEEALAAHETKEAQAPETKKAADNQEAPKEVEKRLNDAYKDLDPLLDDARDTHEDFNDIVGNNELQISIELMETLTSFDDNAGEMLYELAQDPDRLSEISGMSEKEQLKELIKVEDNLGKPKKASVKKHSNAPEPIEVLDGGSDKVKSLDDENLSFEEHQKLLNSRKATSRGGYL